MVEWESKAAKMPRDLNYEKIDEIAAIVEIKQKLIRSGILTNQLFQRDIYIVFRKNS